MIRRAWNGIYRISIFIAVLAASGKAMVLGQELLPSQQEVSSSGHQVVILLDTNPHQKKVLAVELTLAGGIIQKLNRPENAFSVIAFGSQTPNLLKHSVYADEAIATIRGVTIERSKEKYFSVHFYDAMNLALNQFSDDSRSKTLLIVSEGNDYFPHQTFKETVARAQQLQAVCDVAMVADHTFYGTKGIQRYGFDLRRLADKTHGQYLEVGGKQKKVPRSVERLSEGILSRTAKTIGAALAAISHASERKSVPRKN